MKKILIICILLMSFALQAREFYSAKIVMKNGTEKIGLAVLPSNQTLLKKSVKFKTSSNSKVVKIKSNDIYRIFYTLENGNKFVFERNGTIMITKKYYEKREKRCKKSSQDWLLITLSNEKITTYKYATRYYVNKQGKLISEARDNSGTWAVILLSAKRPDEACPANIGQVVFGATVLGVEKQFRKAASIYFKDDQNLVERIKNKEFKKEEVVKLAKIYSN